jgi:hypothetical protein
MLGLWKRSAGMIRRLARSLGAGGGERIGGWFPSTHAALVTIDGASASSRERAGAFADDLDQQTPSPSTNRTEALAPGVVGSGNLKQEEFDLVTAEIRRLTGRLDEQSPD